jgi:hypothetical protein
VTDGFSWGPEVQVWETRRQQRAGVSAHDGLLGPVVSLE